MPLVSVVIPAYNRAHTLVRALDSVIAQTLQDFEIVVVDDASTDNTAEVIRDYSDERIRYLRHDSNQFAAAARNTGIAAATGRYIAFLDSDDAWFPEKLERQIDLLDGDDSDCACSYTGAIVNLAGGLQERTEYRPKFSGDVTDAYLMNRFTIWTPTFLFRRDILKDIETFDTSLKRLEDVDFYLRILQQHRISVVTEPMVELFLEASKGIAEVSEECDRTFLSKHAELINELGTYRARYVRARYELRIGDRYLAEGRALRGLKHGLRAVFYNPFLAPRRYAAFAARLLKASSSR
ncbi:MAG: glycosyltransferase family 2 protein [Gammaproteobacteria bacterium]|nr:glycosyltransferase [Gammaproteobacteria bacterium]NND55219.1 glycosyltransferase family 2 protein [Gammaproteobacteria bacterium]